MGNGGQVLKKINESIQGIHTTIRETQQEIGELKVECEIMHNNIYQALGHICSSLNQLQRAPHQVNAPPVNIQADGRGQQLPVGGAFLVSRPKTLSEQWQEYKSGLNGHKAACLFTLAERDRVYKKYSLHNLVW